MTDREKAIVMAYTGIAMLVGDKIDEFYKYLAELYGRPVYTHELVNLDIASKAKADFIKLCQEEQPEPHWISCKERLPEKEGLYLCTVGADYRNPREMIYAPDKMIADERANTWRFIEGSYAFNWFVIAWKPLPEPYREGEGCII